MKPVECAREQDVLDALASGRWPERCDAELRAHVAGCAICADVADAAGALLGARDAAWDAAQVPESAVMWWRLQVRARQEAARAVARPISFVSALTLTCALAGVVVFLTATAPSWLAWTAWLRDLVPAASVPSLPRPSIDLASLDGRGLAAFVQRAAPLALAAWLVLAPVAVYLAVTED